MLNLILSGFREKKIYIISLVLFILSYLILLTLFSIYNHYNYNISILKNEPINRGIEVYTNNAHSIESYKNIIEKYYPIYANQKIKKENKYYDFNSWNDDIKLSIGKEPKNKNEIVVSKRLYNSLKLNEKDYNKVVEYSINNTIQKFYIVGITSNNQADIYMNKNDFTSLFNIDPNKYYVLINNYSNINNFIENMMNNGLTASLYDSTMQTQIDSMENLKNIYQVVMLFIIILIFMFLLVIVKNNIYHENKNIAIFKAIGYRNSKILNIILVRLFIVSLISYVIMQILSFITFSCFNIFNQYGLTLINLLIYNTITMVIIFLLILINIIFYRSKIVKMNVIDTLKDF